MKNNMGLYEACLALIPLHHIQDMSSRSAPETQPLPDWVLRRLGPLSGGFERRMGRHRLRLRPLIAVIRLTERFNGRMSRHRYEVARPPGETGERLGERVREALVRNIDPREDYEGSHTDTYPAIRVFFEVMAGAFNISSSVRREFAAIPGGG